MTTARLLVIDDDDTLTQLLVEMFKGIGFEVISATSGREGIEKARQHCPDLIILDVMMPHMDGWQTSQRLRLFTDTPIIMLTAKREALDVIHGLELGVDDYIRKPFLLRELELRVRAVLKRYKGYQEAGPEYYDDGVLKIDLSRRQVARHGELVHLTPTEFRLLSCLLFHKGSVVPHQRLLAEVWGPDYVGDTGCLSLYISYLREKLEEDSREPEYIKTQWGTGYWFCPKTTF